MADNRLLTEQVQIEMNRILSLARQHPGEGDLIVAKGMRDAYNGTSDQARKEAYSNLAGRMFANALIDVGEATYKTEASQILREIADADSDSFGAIAELASHSFEDARHKNPATSVLGQMANYILQQSQDPLATVKNIAHGYDTTLQHLVNSLDAEERGRLAHIYTLPYAERRRALTGQDVQDTFNVASLVVPALGIEKTGLGTTLSDSAANLPAKLGGAVPDFAVLSEPGLVAAGIGTLPDVPEPVISTRPMAMFGGASGNNDNNQVDISSVADYKTHREQLLADGRWQWQPILSNKTIADVPDLLKQAEFEVDVNSSDYNVPYFVDTPPLPEYLGYKPGYNSADRPATIDDKQALLDQVRADVVSKLRLLKESESITPEGPEAVLFLYRAGAGPKYMLAAQDGSYAMQAWQVNMANHIDSIMDKVPDRVFYGAQRQAPGSRALSEAAPEYAMTDKFYAQLLDDAYLARYGNPGDQVIRYKLSLGHSVSPKTESLLAVISKDGDVKYVSAKNETIDKWRINPSPSYKNTHQVDAGMQVLREAFFSGHPTEMALGKHPLQQPLNAGSFGTMSAKRQQFYTDVADKVILAKFGQEGDTLTRITLYHTVDANESIVVLASPSGSYKIFDALNDIDSSKPKYTEISKQDALAKLGDHLQRGEAIDDVIDLRNYEIRNMGIANIMLDGLGAGKLPNVPRQTDSGFGNYQMDNMRKFLEATHSEHELDVSTLLSTSNAPPDLGP